MSVEDNADFGQSKLPLSTNETVSPCKEKWYYLGNSAECIKLAGTDVNLLVMFQILWSEYVSLSSQLDLENAKSGIPQRLASPSSSQ